MKTLALAHYMTPLQTDYVPLLSTDQHRESRVSILCFCVELEMDVENSANARGANESQQDG